MTEKIIHFLWLDFKNKKDGVLNDSLQFFKNRIIALHPTWKINFVNDYEKCISEIPEWLKQLLDNKFVGPAHKSDALRYYYLYTFGGVWIDISTFLIKPFDELIENNKEGFTCYYIPSDISASWIINLFSDIYEYISAKEYKTNFIPIQKQVLDIKNKDFDFITENYFLISKKNNEVCGNILEQLKNFWTDALKRINSTEDYCYELNKLMFSLINEIFILKPPLKKLIDLNKVDTNEEYKNTVLKEYLNCSYIFNYLQVYKAIKDYSIKNGGKLTTIINNVERSNVINNSLRLISDDLCDIDNCNNKTIVFESDNNKNINLLSASYNRLTKWSNTREERLSWINTLAGNLLSNNTKTPKEILQSFIDIDITQLKYGAYTRDSSSIKLLMDKFNNKDNIGLIETSQKGGKNKIKLQKKIKMLRKY